MFQYFATILLQVSKGDVPQFANKIMAEKVFCEFNEFLPIL